MSEIIDGTLAAERRIMTPTLAKVAALAAVLSGLAFLVELHWGFNLGDEGYLWYGAQHLLHGEVPLRDFMAYDPGRYVLAGIWMRLAGSDSILALRTVLGLVTVSAVTLACVLVARSWRLQEPWRIAPAALLFMLWMAPRYKVFDIGASVVAVAMIAHVLARPGRVRLLLLGISIGMLAILGRNHGVYALVAGVLACLWMLGRKDAGRIPGTLANLAVGVGVGYAPLLACMLFIPGFAIAMWESIRLMFEYGATNLPLPVPWPWTAIRFRPFDMPTVLMGCAFVGLLIFDIAGLYLMWFSDRRRSLPPLFVAAVCASIPYTHYAFSRADLSHLSQAIMPMLIGLAAGTKERPATAWRSMCLPVLMLAFCLPFALRLHPRYDAWRYAGHWRRTHVGTDALMLSPQEADNVDLLMQLRDTKRAPGPILVAPLWPGAYPLYRQSSPDWEIYPLVPRTAGFQEAEIRRLKKARIGLAIVLDARLDGRDDLRYVHTHPLIYGYLARCFSLRPLPKEPAIKVFDGPDRCGDR